VFCAHGSSREIDPICVTAHIESMSEEDVLSHDMRRAERAAVKARLDRLDADREKLARQLHELEVAERVLSRFGRTPPASRSRSDRTAGANAPTSTRGRSRPPRETPSASAGRKAGGERVLVLAAGKKRRELYSGEAEYRGVKLQPLVNPPKPSRQRQLQEALKDAIAKNAAALRSE
jgi:hypothetical protein